MMATALSKPAIIAAILCITLSFAIVTEAWLPCSHRTVIRNTRGHQRPVDDIIIHVETTHTAKQSATQLSLFKYKDTDSESSPPIIELDIEQDQALRDSTPAMEEAYGIAWFEQSEAWDELKNQYPSLQEYSNDDLRRAFIAQKPTVGDLLTRTPLGPLIVLNGICWLGGFSWCDTPFHGADACLP